MKRWLVVAVLVLLATSVQAEVSSVGFWNFDEGSGVTAEDSSGEANHGTVNGATWIAGALGPHALRFDGDDGVAVGDRTSLEPTTLTVSLCLRSPTLPPHYSILLSEGLEGCDCASYAIVKDVQGNIAFYTCTGTSANSSPLVPQDGVWDGNWHRIVGTYDGDFVRIYLDGVLVGSPVAGVTPSYSLSTHSDFQIGNLGACGVRGFVGDIDEVGVWDGALSDSEIENLDECFKLLSDGFESGGTSGWSSTTQ